jgi:putative tricarboxylic transport membrane protein
MSIKLSDRVTGIGIASAGLVVFAAARQLPPMPGQQIGPSVFPSLIGLALCLCGVLIALGVGTSFESSDDDSVQHRSPADLAGNDPEKTSPWRVLLPIALLLFYVAAVGTLGFVLVAAAMVAVMALALGARLRLAVILALLAPPIVHVIFAKALRVPLAAGWLPLPW